MDDCILWEGYVQSGGYGQVYSNGKRILVHRKAWMEKYGCIPKGLHVCHRCDNPLCINTNHLFLGTPRDNVRDCISKDRFNFRALHDATKLPRSRKLTDKDVLDIRTIHHGTSLKDLSLIYGVSMACISMVRRGLRK